MIAKRVVLAGGLAFVIGCGSQPVVITHDDETEHQIDSTQIADESDSNGSANKALGQNQLQAGESRDKQIAAAHGDRLHAVGLKMMNRGYRTEDDAVLDLSALELILSTGQGELRGESEGGFIHRWDLNARVEVFSGNESPSKALILSTFIDQEFALFHCNNAQAEFFAFVGDFVPEDQVRNSIREAKNRFEAARLKRFSRQKKWVGRSDGRLFSASDGRQGRYCIFSKVEQSQSRQTEVAIRLVLMPDASQQEQGPAKAISW